MALLLVCATFVLITVGGLVTTTGAGMAFRDWPSSDGHSMFLYPWLASAGAKFVEHGHRLLGATVGMITIGLVLSIWIADSRRWLCWLGVLALVMVIAQGVLGGMRVRHDALGLAKIHGCLGPLFFSLCVALAVFTSKHWRAPPTPAAGASAARLRNLAIITTVLVFVQLLLGAQIRHIPPQSGTALFRVALFFHLLIAGLILTQVGWLFARVVRGGHEPVLRRPVFLLALLLLVQIGMGCATWVVKYGWPLDLFREWSLVATWTNTAGSLGQSSVVTAHVAVGSLILGVSVMLMLRTLRSSVPLRMLPLITVGVAS